MKEQDNFIKNLSNLLEEEGITQRELAEKIGVTEVTISRYLSGERNPRIEIVSKIANFFNVTTDYLLGLSDEKENSSTETEDKRLIAFRQGYDELEDADKDILLATLDALVKARKGEK